MDDNKPKVINLYFSEVAEVVVILLLASLFTPNKSNYFYILKISFVIALVTTTLEYYDQDKKNTVKNAFLITIAGMFIKSI